MLTWHYESRCSNPFRILLKRTLLLAVCMLFTPMAVAGVAVITLEQAIKQTLSQNPAFELFAWRSKVLESHTDTANLSPAWVAGLEAENLMGSGEYSGFDSAEYTLSLSSVIELDDRRNARVQVAHSRLALDRARQQAQALELVSRVTRAFIHALIVQEKMRVAEVASALAEESFQLVDRRVKSGASPAAEKLRAQVDLQQVQLNTHALERELASAKFALRSFWADDNPAGSTADSRLQGNLFLLDSAGNFAALMQKLESSQLMHVIANEQQLREAEITLAKSRSAGDIEWGLGVRRFEGSGDSALTAGVSIPLFSGKRQQSQVTTALARREQVNAERDITLRELKVKVYDAWQNYNHFAEVAKTTRSELLPLMEKALEQSRRFYERGRYSYTEWASVQRDLLDLQLSAIDAAGTALLNRALIEQMTGAALPTDFSQTARP